MILFWLIYHIYW